MRYAPSSPFQLAYTLWIGSSIGFDEIQTERIMIELVDDGYVESSIVNGDTA